MNDKIWYIAGVLDSGCQITIEKQLFHYRPVLSVVRKSRECLLPIQEMFGGTVVPFGSSFRYRVKSKVAKKVLEEMQPYMLTKQKEISIIQQLYEHMGESEYEDMRVALYKAIHNQTVWFENKA